MRIALDSTYSLDRLPTGVSVYSREILDGLAAAHPEAEFLCCYRPHRFARSFGVAMPSNCRRRLLAGSFCLPRAALFHGLNQRLPDARAPKMVATFHDLFVLSGDYSTPEFRRRFAGQARHAAARADLLIAVSRFTASQLESLLKVEPARIRVVPHGVRSLADSGRPRPPREKLVLNVGAIQHRKNVAGLVEAFERMPTGWRLVIAGSAGYGANEALRRIDASSRRSDIEVAGYVTDERLADLYARASIFAFPSLDEGFGMPVLEAMARGTPVLTSNGSALKEVAGDAAMLVDPKDSGSIAGALLELASDEALGEKLAGLGRERAAAYTWDRAVRGTWSVYRELC